MGQAMIGHRIQSLARVLAVLLVVCAAVGCGGGSSSTTSSSPPPTGTAAPHARVKMPDVVGYSVQLAKQTIRSYGLVGPTKEERSFNGATPQTIAGTAPSGGQSVLADSPVILFVSQGTQTCPLCSAHTRTVPPLCGLTLQAANTRLVEDDITLNLHPFHRPSAKPAGTVIGSAPAAGASIVAYGGSVAKEVVVTISSGPAPPSSTVAPSAEGPDTC
jgi:beta-lactam-binding protein with PASTA domain